MVKFYVSRFAIAFSAAALLAAPQAGEAASWPSGHRVLDWLAARWAGGPVADELSYVDDGFRAPVYRAQAAAQRNIPGRGLANASGLPWSEPLSPTRSSGSGVGASGFGGGGGAGGSGFGAVGGGSVAQGPSAGNPPNLVPVGATEAPVDFLTPAAPGMQDPRLDPDLAPNAGNLLVAPLPASAMLLIAGLGGFAALSFRRRA